MECGTIPSKSIFGKTASGSAEFVQCSYPVSKMEAEDVAANGFNDPSDVIATVGKWRNCFEHPCGHFLLVCLGQHLHTHADVGLVMGFLFEMSA